MIALVIPRNHSPLVVDMKRCIALSSVLQLNLHMAKARGFREPPCGGVRGSFRPRHGACLWPHSHHGHALSHNQHTLIENLSRNHAVSTAVEERKVAQSPGQFLRDAEHHFHSCSMFVQGYAWPIQSLFNVTIRDNLLYSSLCTLGTSLGKQRLGARFVSPYLHTQFKDTAPQDGHCD